MSREAPQQHALPLSIIVHINIAATTATAPTTGIGAATATATATAATAATLAFAANFVPSAATTSVRRLAFGRRGRVWPRSVVDRAGLLRRSSMGMPTSIDEW